PGKRLCRPLPKPLGHVAVGRLCRRRTPHDSAGATDLDLAADASERAPASERQATACVAGERRGGRIPPRWGRQNRGMAYNSTGLVIHEADAHIMEPPNWLRDHADPAIRDRIAPLRYPGG